MAKTAITTAISPADLDALGNDPILRKLLGEEPAAYVARMEGKVFRRPLVRIKASKLLAAVGLNDFAESLGKAIRAYQLDPSEQRLQNLIDLFDQIVDWIMEHQSEMMAVIEFIMTIVQIFLVI